MRCLPYVRAAPARGCILAVPYSLFPVIMLPCPGLRSPRGGRRAHQSCGNTIGGGMQCENGGREETFAWRLLG